MFSFHLALLLFFCHLTRKLNYNATHARSIWSLHIFQELFCIFCMALYNTSDLQVTFRDIISLNSAGKLNHRLLIANICIWTSKVFLKWRKKGKIISNNDSVWVAQLHWSQDSFSYSNKQWPINSFQSSKVLKTETVHCGPTKCSIEHRSAD